MGDKSVPDPVGFAELSTIEQIEYLQALWDRVVDGECEVPVLESHLDVAEERLKAYRKAPEHAQPAFELLDRLAREAE